MKTALLHILRSLSQGSVESVQNGQSFSQLGRYLHIRRDIENILFQKMESIVEEGGGLILLVGSAGDGKSHLLSSIKELPEFANMGFKTYNDATESYSPTKTAIDTLKDVLTDFSDAKIDTTTKKLVLAINIGKLNAFFEDNSVKDCYSKLISFVAHIFDENSTKVEDTSRLKIVQFANHQIFEFQKDEDLTYPVDS